MAKDGAIVVLWNPSLYLWPDLEQDVERAAVGKQFTLGWTTGRRKEIPENTLVFWRRVRKKPLGFMGYGYTCGPVQQRKGRSKDARGWTRKYWVNIEVKDLVDPLVDGVLGAESFVGDKELIDFSKIQGTAGGLSQGGSKRLLDHWLKWRVQEESDVGQSTNRSTPASTEPLFRAKEGEKQKVMRVHRYRERRLRIAKLEETLKKNTCLPCEVCGDDLADWYGPNYADLVEVHHKKAIGRRSIASVTLLKDLAIVCPTCHRFIHRHDPMLSIAQARQLMV